MMSEEGGKEDGESGRDFSSRVRGFARASLAFACNPFSSAEAVEIKKKKRAKRVDQTKGKRQKSRNVCAW